VVSDNERIVIETDDRGRMSIGVEDSDGSGRGYRLAGTKYCGCHPGKTVVRAVLDDRDVEEIRSYLAIHDEIKARKAAEKPTGWVALAGQFAGTLDHPETVWRWDNRYHAAKGAARAAGFTLADGTDDFNLGRVEDGVLTWFGWMDEQHPVEDCAEIAAQFGWTVNGGAS
jgi:hypothetical protein